MVYNLCARATPRPHHIFIATDIENTFSALRRATKCFASCYNTFSFLAPIMALLWRLDSISKLVPNE